jgi:hypothetical protein
VITQIRPYVVTQNPANEKCFFPCHSAASGGFAPATPGFIAFLPSIRPYLEVLKRNRIPDGSSLSCAQLYPGVGPRGHELSRPRTAAPWPHSR